ncbi:MAG TPA: AAA family ATPase, partial [Gammaproteobacteria bacterium]|nr:AAA family ATPase [Gammaproteobacteria bacterium]
MYHAHFGLEHGLCGDAIAADGDVFRTAKHDRLIAHFKLALASPSSCIVLHGPAGVGKTTLTAAALRATSTRLAIAWLGGMATTASELLELLLVELGVSTVRTTRMERVQLWRQFQGEMRATDSRLFIVVERTEDLSPEVLHALDQLTAPDAAGNPGANVVFLGHATIFEHLASPLLDSLRQRIRLSTALEPFTEADLQDYLRHQVAAAGGNFERIFATGAVAALHRYSKGVVRLANTLCESALDIAAVQQQKQLTGELVAKTAVTLLGLAEPAAAVQSAPGARSPAAHAPAPAAAPAAPRPAAHAAPIFERRSEPRLPTSVSPVPPEVRAAPAPAAAPASAAIAPTPSKTDEIDFDGSITDVADVALAD